MDMRVSGRRVLDSDETKSYLSVCKDLASQLNEFSQIELESEESCRALLAAFTYVWSVAEASRLPVLAELAEIGIVETSIRLGYRLDERSASAKWVRHATIDNKLRCKNLVVVN